MIWSDPLLVAARVAAILDNLGVSYLIGGSLASSVYGNPRATQDVDLIAALQLRHVDPLVTSLGSDFYVSPDAAPSCSARCGDIQRGSSCDHVQGRHLCCRR